ncbi:MAG TPA: protoporphyrinogen oxidase, partial [Terriglobales bacterium]|nr:protoporphyrinogen oxidase [Terriglobales bacterium]
MKRIAIIGGGISGLAAAHALEKLRLAGAAIEYRLLEAGSRLGGVLRTEIIDDCLIEAGPDSFLTEKSWAADFCRELGLGDQLMGSNDSTRKTYILLKGRLAPMPDGLMFMVPTKILPVLTSPLFSLSTKLRMAREWFHKPYASNDDEPVAALVARHYGQEIVDRLIDPLLCGIYGGDAARLSVKAVLPRFTEMEKTTGSFSRAMLAARRKSAGTSPRPLFTTLKGGMQQISDAIGKQLDPASVRCGAGVQTVELTDAGWMILGETFDALIVAVPSQSAAEMLQSTSADLATELRSIEYSSSVTVALGYGREVRAALPPGFGLLAPRSEGKRLLAATFVHNKFNCRAPEDRAVIRCFLGGTRDEAVLDLEDGEIVQIVQRELREILKITAEP